MPKLPRVSGKELLRALERAGFRVEHTTGSHATMYHPGSDRTTTVPLHRSTLPVGLTAGILRQAGLDTEDLRALLK